MVGESAVLTRGACHQNDMVRPHMPAVCDWEGLVEGYINPLRKSGITACITTSL